jgi:hypothetical protein
LNDSLTTLVILLVTLSVESQGYYIHFLPPTYPVVTCVRQYRAFERWPSTLVEPSTLARPPALWPLSRPPAAMKALGLSGGDLRHRESLGVSMANTIPTTLLKIMETEDGSVS